MIDWIDINEKQPKDGEIFIGKSQDGFIGKYECDNQSEASFAFSCTFWVSLPDDTEDECSYCLYIPEDKGIAPLTHWAKLD